MNMFKKQEFRSIKITENQNLGDIQIPIIIVSGVRETLGIIINVNSSAAKMFGYTKNELLNKNVGILMPEAMRRNHQKWLRSYLETGVSDYLNRERKIVGLHKGNYLISCSTYIKPIPMSHQKGVNFAGFFTVKKRFKFECWILGTVEDKLLNFSPSTPYLLNIKKEVLMMTKKISYLFPDIMAKMKEGEENGFRPSFNYSLSSILEKAPGTPKNFRNRSFSTSRYGRTDEVTVEVSYIKVRGTKKFLILRVKEAVEKKSPARSKFADSADYSNLMHPGISGGLTHKDFEDQKDNYNYYFFYTLTNLSLSGMFIEKEKDIVASRRKISEALWNTNMGNETDIYYQRLVEKRKDLEQEGVAVFHLRNNMVIPKQRSYQDMEEDSINDGLIGQQSNTDNQRGNDPLKSDDLDEDGSFEDFTSDELKNFLNERKNLEELIDNQPKPTRLKFLQFFGNFLYFFIFAMTFFEFMYMNRQSTTTLKELDSNLKIRILANDYLDISKYIFDLINIQKIQKEDMKAYESSIKEKEYLRCDFIKKMIKLNIEEIKECKTKMGSGSLPEKIQEKKIKVLFKNIGVKEFSISEVSEQLLGKVIEKSKIVESPLESFTIEDEGNHFIIFNILNSFSKSLHEISLENYQEIIDDNLLIQKVFFTLFMISVLYQIIAQIILTKSVSYVSESSKNLLTIFLTIPEKQIKYYFDKTEIFMLSLQQSDGVIQMSDDEEIEELKGDDIPSSVFGRKSKKFKYDNKRDFSNLMQMYFFGVTVISYCMSSYNTSRKLSDRLNNLIVQHKFTNKVEFSSNLVLTGLRVLSIQPEIGIFNKNISKKGYGEEDLRSDIGDLLKELYFNYEKFTSLNIENMRSNKEEYLEKYDQIMFGNLCKYLDKRAGDSKFGIIQKQLKKCHELSSNIGSLGLNVAFSKLFSEVNKIYLNEPRGEYFLNKSRFEDIIQLWRNEVKVGIRDIAISFGASLKDIVESALLTKFVLFTIYLVLLIALYFIVWLPSYYKVSADHQESLNIIKMLPPFSIKKVKEVRKILKSLSKKVKYNA